MFFSGQLEDDVVKMDILLRERNFGVMENKPLADYLKTAKSAGFKKPHQFTPEGGESAREVRQRVENFMKVNFGDIGSALNSVFIDILPRGRTGGGGGPCGKNMSTPLPLHHCLHIDFIISFRKS